jgi:predicted AAA+ superfamily ATPase
MSDATGLRPWTELVRPHHDVASGELSMGTYAANLAAATLGTDGLDVYAKADDFFRATYVTQTMKDVLGGIFGALAGGKGDRVVQLRTPFGGGKTHSLLALYHLATDRDAARVSPELDGLPDPGPVRVAVLSGEWLDSARGRTVDGRTIRTLWGELALQLGGWAAFDELLVDGQEASRLRVSASQHS